MESSKNHRMKKKSLYSLLLIGLILFSHHLRAQIAPSDSIRYCIETDDGNAYYGYILAVDDITVNFKTANIGTITIHQAHIKKINALDEDKFIEGKYYHDIFQASRYFWSPNGYGLKKGEGYYQNVWILYNQFSYAISSNFSIGGGLVPLFLFDGAPTPIWVIPKFSLPVVKDLYNVGVGALAGTILGEEETGFGILYGVNTIGPPDKNFTLGIGWGYAGTDWADSPIITLSGMVRTGPKGYLMTENFIIDVGEDSPLVLVSAGGRTMIRRTGIDYGLFIPFMPDLDVFVAVPWLGITIPFGTNYQD